MARFNKIYAGPFTEAMPQVQEAIAKVALTPGTIAFIDAAGLYDVAVAGTTATLRVIQDNYLIGATVSTPIAIGDTAIGMEMLDEQFFNVLVPTGQNVAKGDPLALGAGGKLVKGAGRVVAFAEETFNNTTGADQLVRVRVAKNAA